MQFQVKRGSTAQAAAWIGAEGSFFIDLTLKLLYIHDGVTAGGELVGGLNEAATNALIAQALQGQTLTIADIVGLDDALADTVKTDQVGTSVASLVAGKVPVEQLPEPVEVPVAASGAELVEGTDATKFATAQALLALLTDIGFSKDGDGNWVLDAGVVV